MRVELCRKRSELYRVIMVTQENINDIYNMISVNVDLRNFLGCYLVIDHGGYATLYQPSAFKEAFEILEVYP